MADEVLKATIQVRQHWSRQNLNIQQIHERDILDVQVALGVRLPEDYVSFLRLAGLPDDEDTEGFRFWRPRELRFVGDVLQSAGYASRGTDVAIVIADYLQESWWYAIWVSGPHTAQVSLVLGAATGTDPQPPLGTIKTFLLAYLRDDEILYPAK